MPEYLLVTPPGWPSEVPPPGADGWRDRAIGWLLERTAPGWTKYRDLWNRHPNLLARHVLIEHEAVLEQLRKAYSTTRVDLKELGYEPHQVDALLGFYAGEGPRILAEERAVQLVADALNGVRWRPGIKKPAPRDDDGVESSPEFQRAKNGQTSDLPRRR